MSEDLISRKALIEEIRNFRCSITGLRAGKGVLARAADEYRESILWIFVKAYRAMCNRRKKRLERMMDKHFEKNKENEQQQQAAKGENAWKHGN